METNRKAYSENDSRDQDKIPAENGHTPRQMDNDNAGGNLGNVQTTGTGYSQAERSGVDPRNTGIPHEGSEELADQYNIDEQAHLDSSKADFVKTTSNFHHADGHTETDPTL